MIDLKLLSGSVLPPGISIGGDSGGIYSVSSLIFRFKGGKELGIFTIFSETMVQNYLSFENYSISGTPCTSFDDLNSFIIGLY